MEGIDEVLRRSGQDISHCVFRTFLTSSFLSNIEALTHALAYEYFPSDTHSTQISSIGSHSIVLAYNVVRIPIRFLLFEYS